MPPPDTQWFGDGILVTFEGGFQHTINIDNNTFFELFQAIDFAADFSADVNGRIYNNTITYTEGVGAIAFGTGSSSTSSMLFQMLIEDNDIGGLGNDSGSRLGSGIVGDFRGAETARVTIHQNVVQDTEVNPINIISQMTLGQDGDTHLRITNNTVASIDDDEGGGAGVIPGINVTTNAATNGDIFLTLTGNTSTGINEEGVLLRQATANNTFQIEDLVPASGATGPQIETFLEGLNSSTVRVRIGGSVVQYTAMNNNNTNTPAPVTPLLAAQGQGPGGSGMLTTDMLAPIMAEAAHRWADAGITAEQMARLGGVTFTIGNLVDGMLAATSGRNIAIDDDAAGWGWFVDPTPADNLEFGAIHSGTELAATGAEATDHLDLLTTVMHEIGHVLGLEHTDTSENLMNEAVDVGLRRLPDALDVAASNVAGVVSTALQAVAIAQFAEAALPAAVQAKSGTTIIAGGSGDDTLEAGQGGSILVGGAGSDTFVFNLAPQHHVQALTAITHVADYHAAQGDTLDFSAFLGVLHAVGVPDSALVRVVEDVSGTFATVLVNAGDAVDPSWMNAAVLAGVHQGDAVNVVLATGLAAAQLHADWLV